MEVRGHQLVHPRTEQAHTRETKPVSWCGHLSKNESCFFRLFCSKAADCDSHHNSRKLALLPILASLVTESSAAISWVTTVKKRRQCCVLIWAECCLFYHILNQPIKVKIKERSRTDDELFVEVLLKKNFKHVTRPNCNQDLRSCHHTGIEHSQGHVIGLKDLL